MSDDLDHIMEQASQRLAEMDYLGCEVLCLRALAMARGHADWWLYASILMPLQEARRQRRIIACEGTLRLGTASLTDAPENWLASLSPGAIVITQPHDALAAREFDDLARAQHCHVEVLFAASAADSARWTIQSFRGPQVVCEVSAPPAAWRDRLLRPGEGVPTAAGLDPAGWFIAATEKLGDAALASINAKATLEQRLHALEGCLEVVTDHEIIHQTLADTARQLHRTMTHT